jgi:hypothetical protein
MHPFDRILKFEEAAQHKALKASGTINKIVYNKKANKNNIAAY